MNRFYIKKLQILLCISVGLLASLTSLAQYTPSVLATGGTYTAVATDRQNRVYVVAWNSASKKYEVRQYPSGSTGTYTTLYAELAGPGVDHSWGIAVNSHGDVYITNPNPADNWEVIKLAAGTFTPSVILQGRYYTAVTTDANDNLLTMEYDGTANYVVARYDANGGNRAVLFTGIPVAAGAGAYPWGIVTDRQNNIYILDLPNSPENGKLIKLTAPGYTPTTLASGKGYSSLAIDAAGNLYTSELASGSTYHVMKYAAPALTSATEIYTGLSIGPFLYPWGLAVDGHGDVYVNDPAAASGTGKFIKLTGDPVSVVSVLRASPTPTGASTVDFTVTFSAPVSNITPSAFSITTTGSIMGSPHTVSISGSGAVYTVTVNTGTGNGTLQLGVTDIGVLNHLSNIPYSTGEVYTIIRTTQPTGGFTINGGAAYTNNPAVNLAITSTNAQQMRFANDGGPYTAYEPVATTKNFTLSPGDGSKLVHMQLKDAAGNEPVFDASISLDQTPPVTGIVNKPPPVTSSTTATFVFSSTEANSIYEASLDGGIYALSQNPAVFSGLSPGTHSLSVRAIDPAGNVDPTPEVYSWVVDQNRPVITSVDVPANGYYTSGNKLNFTVHFDENVLVNAIGGVPYLEVIIGTTIRHAVYTGGDGTSALSFSYTVQPGDMDMDGITLGTALMANGGTIRDAGGNDAESTVHAVGSTAAVFVNTGGPGVTISTTVPPLVNQPFTVTATFTEAITGFTIGDMTVTNATMSNLLTTDNIIYTLLITPTTDGAVSVQVPAGVAVNIAHNGNTASNTLSLTYDGTAPAVTSVDVPANGTYNRGNVLYFAVHYAENIRVTGTPSLDIVIGNVTRQATYTGGSGTNTLMFSYTVQDNDMDKDGITLGAHIALNQDTLKDAAGNNAQLPLSNIASTTGVMVDAVAPVVTSVSVPANGYYTTGDVLHFTVVFDENTYVSTVGGTPYLEVTIGATTRHAAYGGGTGTAVLYFNYTVQPGDMDMDGIAVGSALVLDGATIRDAVGNDAGLTLHAVQSTAAVFVNTAIPGAVISTTATSPVTQPFTANIRFTEAVTGFTQSDIAVTNASLSNFLTTDHATYTVLVTPVTSGGISLQVPANVAVNIGNNGNTASNKLTLDFANTPPAITPGQSWRIDENRPNGDSVGTVTATDVNTATIFSHWTITGGQANNAFAVDPSTGVITVADGSKLDFEKTPAFTLRLTVSDGVNTSEAETVLIHLNDLNDNRPVIKPGQGLAIDENSKKGTALGTVTATDADAGTAFGHWTITGGNANDAFAIEANTGRITVKNDAALDYETTTVFTLKLTVSDGTHTSAEESVAVHLNDLPEAPTGISLSAETLYENQPAGQSAGKLSSTAPDRGATFTYSLVQGTGDTDNSLFHVDGDVLSTAAPLDYEQKSSYHIRIRSTTQSGLFLEKDITVDIDDVNEVPTLDAIADQTVCYTGAQQAIRLDGISAGGDKGQTTRLAISADNAALFKSLTVSGNKIAYVLEDSATGTTILTVTVQDDGGTTHGGVDHMSRSFTLIVKPLPVITIGADHTNPVSKGILTRLTAAGAERYQWASGPGIQNGWNDATLAIRPQQDAIYTVTGTSTEGCTAKQQYAVQIVADYELVCNNIVSPNGDGKNDTWIIQNVDSYPNNEVMIYDRAGRLIYHKKHYDNQWNGIINGGKLAEGTYYYLFLVDGGKKIFKGYIELLTGRR